METGGEVLERMCILGTIECCEPDNSFRQTHIADNRAIVSNSLKINVTSQQNYRYLLTVWRSGAAASTCFEGTLSPAAGLLKASVRCSRSPHTPGHHPQCGPCTPEHPSMQQSRLYHTSSQAISSSMPRIAMSTCKLLKRHMRSKQFSAGSLAESSACPAVLHRPAMLCKIRIAGLLNNDTLICDAPAVEQDPLGTCDGQGRLGGYGCSSPGGCRLQGGHVWKDLCDQAHVFGLLGFEHAGRQRQLPSPPCAGSAAACQTSSPTSALASWGPETQVVRASSLTLPAQAAQRLCLKSKPRTCLWPPGL